MDIEFSIHDVFSLTRPQWKLASNLDEATKAFQMAVAQDQKVSGADKVAEVEEGSSGESSDEEVDELDHEVEGEEDSATDEEDAEVSFTTEDIKPTELTIS